jgi:hypothetical protein
MREYCCEVTAKDSLLVAEYATTIREAVAKATASLSDIKAESNTTYSAQVSLWRRSGSRLIAKTQADTPQVAVAGLIQPDNN